MVSWLRYRIREGEVVGSKPSLAPPAWFPNLSPGAWRGLRDGREVMTLVPRRSDCGFKLWFGQ